MPHALIVTVIFAAYFGLMALLFAYLASQVRQHDDPEREQPPEPAPRAEDPGELLAAA